MPDKESNLFDQLRSKQLVGVSRDNFSNATDQTFIEECNLDEFKLINVIGQATNMQSQSGPMPGTLSITETDTGSTANTKVIMFRPPDDGSMWQIVDVSFNQVDGGSYNWLLEIGDGALFVSLIDRGSTSDGAVQFDLWPGAPQYVDYDNYLTGHFLKVSGGSLTESTGKVLAVRVR